MSCNCSLDMDIRGRCWVTDRKWKKCPVKSATVWWHLKNDRETGPALDRCQTLHEGFVLVGRWARESKWKLTLDEIEVVEGEYCCDWYMNHE